MNPIVIGGRGYELVIDPDADHDRVHENHLGELAS